MKEDPIFDLRKQVLDVLMKNERAAREGMKYLSEVMVALISLAADLHTNVGGSEKGFMDFVKGVWDVPTDKVSNKPKKRKKVVN